MSNKESKKIRIKKQKKEKIKENERGEKEVKERKKEIFTNRGITLVALIITIIVLLILAGVSISFVFNGGILDKTQQAADEYKNSAAEEENLLSTIDSYLEKQLSNVDENGLAKENILIKTDVENVQIVISKGMAPVYLKETGTTTSNPGQDGAVKEIIPVAEWKNITAEQINKGIVLVDHAITYDGGQSTGTVPDFNEYVWIPITESNKFARIAWLTAGYDQTGNWSKEQIEQVLSNNSTTMGWREDTTSKEYTNLVASIELYKGFYVSRYEASNNGSNLAQSKRGQTVWSDSTQPDAITACKKVNSTLNSHLIYGIEWDSILNWLNGNAIIGSSVQGENKIMTVDDLQTDSRSWGNYKDSISDAADKAGGDLPNPAGASEYWKANNIYDLAGNVWEWTQERWATKQNTLGGASIRGSYFQSSGTGNATAAMRNDSGIGDSRFFKGIRFCLYITPNSKIVS